jgi:hypothetical protein
MCVKYVVPEYLKNTAETDPQHSLTVKNLPIPLRKNYTLLLTFTTMCICVSLIFTNSWEAKGGSKICEVA